MLHAVIVCVWGGGYYVRRWRLGEFMVSYVGVHDETYWEYVHKQTDFVPQ